MKLEECAITEIKGRQNPSLIVSWNVAPKKICSDSNPENL